jgi:hypothetical protein
VKYWEAYRLCVDSAYLRRVLPVSGHRFLFWEEKGKTREDKNHNKKRGKVLTFGWGHFFSIRGSQLAAVFLGLAGTDQLFTVEAPQTL